METIFFIVQVIFIILVLATELTACFVVVNNSIDCTKFLKEQQEKIEDKQRIMSLSFNDSLCFARDEIRGHCNLVYEMLRKTEQMLKTNQEAEKKAIMQEICEKLMKGYQEVRKMSYRVKPNRHEITIDFVFEHDGEEYNFKVVERDARQAILDEFVKPEGREAVDKFLKENDLWEETLSKLDTFLNEYFEEEFHREVRKW